MRKKNSIPMRTCAGCRVSKDKKELIRIVRQPDGTVVLDRSGKLNGRGTYLCPDAACLLKARKSKSIERSLSVAIPEIVYEELKKELLI